MTPPGNWSANPDLSRRAFGGLFAAAVAGLAACSSDVKDSGSVTSGSPSQSASGARFPVSVNHKFGTTVVPAAPTRVVSAGFTEQDTLLALGVIPVGITDWYGDQPHGCWPWATSALGAAKPTMLKLDDGFQFEKIAALAPALIVAPNAGMTKADYAKLSAIAPTIAQSGKYTDYFEPWYIQAQVIGTAIGKASQTKKLVDDIDAAFAAKRKQNPSFEGKKVIFLQSSVYDGSVIAYQNGLSTDFLSRLGLVVPDGLEKFAKDGQAYIPVEQLSVLNSADVLIWATEKDEDVSNLYKVPGFDRLKAVVTNKCIYTGGVLSGAIYFTSPLSLPYVLDNLTPKLIEATR